MSALLQAGDARSGRLWRLAFAVLVVYALRPWRTRRYRRLLARIEALEIELGMREAKASAMGLLSSGEFKHRVTRAAFYGDKSAAA